MALQKNSINIPFSQGLETKTDPKQISPGKFLRLVNKVFNKLNLLAKRNGFGDIISLSNTDASSIVTLNDNIVATGNQLYAYSPESNTIINKGNIIPINLSVMPLVRTATSQNTVDSAMTSNGIICTVWEDSDGFKYYQIIDSNNSNVLVQKTVFPSTYHLPRVFIIGRYFVITFLTTITATVHLQYIAIPINNLNSPLSAVDISTQVFSNTAAYDGQVIDGQLYIAWNGNDMGDAVRITYISSNLAAHATTVLATKNAVMISICGDISGNNPIIWLSFIDASGNGWSIPYDPQLMALHAIIQTLTTVTAINLTSTALNNVCSIFYEVSNTYSYSSKRTDYISKVTVNTAGTVVSPVIVLRSVGLTSKAFLMNNIAYMLVAYAGTYEPTFFLMRYDGIVIVKLAFSNGAGYPSTTILPNFNVYGTSVSIGYLFKAQVVPVNKSVNIETVGGLYGQLGINMAKFTFSGRTQAVEIAGALHINGGFLRMYDGTIPVEHNFHLYPEDLGATSATTGGGLTPQQYFYQATYEWTDANGNIHRSAPSIPIQIDLTGQTGTAVKPKSVFLSGVTTLTLNSIVGLHVGQTIIDNTTGGNIAPNTTIIAISGSTITISLPTLGASAVAPGDELQTTDTFAITVNVPNLRITDKVGSSKVRLVLYRWSVSQQNFYQTSSITSPIINITTSDSQAIVDTNNDAEIIGNPLVYTTGGVVENIAAPACNSMALYKSRLFLIDAEDTNLEWYSKKVIENTPVEMSDLFTYFVPPTTGSEESTGNLKCLFPMDDKLISFKGNAAYYTTGDGPDNTGAQNDFSDPVFITSTVGSDNQFSLGFIPNGVIFQSNKGIWLLGRDLSTSYIGAPVEAFNAASVLSTVVIPETNQIRFTLDNDITLMYDYYAGQWGTFENIPSISSTIWRGKHTYLNEFGQIRQENDNYIDGTNPVLVSFTTGWMNLAGLQGFERAYFIYLLGQFITPHKLQIQIAYDYDPAIVQTSVIYPDNFSPAYGDISLYGSSSPYAGVSQVEQWRIFLEKQKCQAFQITLNEIYDPSYDVPAGAGLTLSGLNLVFGQKAGYPKLDPKYSVG